MKAKFLIYLCLTFSLLSISTQYDRCENDDYIRPVYGKYCIPCPPAPAATTLRRLVNTTFKKVTYTAGKPDTCEEVASCTTDFSIHPTGECVAACPPRFYSFNKVCYEECPEDITKLDPVSGTCDCIYRNYTDGNGVLHCLGKDIKCPNEYPFYYPATQECLTKKCTGKSHKIFNNVTNETNFECIDACPANQYEFTDLDGYTTCVNKCPNHTYLNVKSLQCIAVADCDDYYDKKNQKCYKDVTTTEKCPKYKFYNGSKYQCMDDCDEGAIFKDEAAKQCDIKCSEASSAKIS